MCTKCRVEHPDRVCDFDVKTGECAENRPRRHVYREYTNLGITVCQNCAKFNADIEREPHYIFEHGYCASDCARCEAEICILPAMEFIKPL